MTRFQTVFGTRKPVIAMVHLGVLPGTPLYDADAGLTGLVEAARAAQSALQSAGVDAVMFGNAPINSMSISLRQRRWPM